MLVKDTLVDQLGRNSRHDYLARFTPQANFQMLTRIYEFARRHAQGISESGASVMQPASRSVEEAECRA